jgi:hypothetical protein
MWDCSWFEFKPKYAQILIGLNTMIDVDQMILSGPSIITMWTYQDMMVWVSWMLVGEMAGANEDFGSGVEEL